jgi:hypothetical protein
MTATNATEMDAGKGELGGYTTPENSTMAGYLQQQEEEVRRQAYLRQQQEKLRQHLWRLQSERPSQQPSMLANIAEQLDAMQSKSSVDAPLIVQAYREAGQETEVPDGPRLRSASTDPHVVAMKRDREASTPSQRDEPHRDHTQTHWSTGHWVGDSWPIASRTVLQRLLLTAAACTSQRLALNEGCWPRRPDPTPNLQASCPSGTWTGNQTEQNAYAQPTDSCRAARPDLPSRRRRKRHRSRSSKVMNPVAVMTHKFPGTVVNPAAFFTAHS